MPLYVLLGRSTGEGARELSGLRTRHEHAVRRAEDLGARLVSSYALLGDFDYLAILECPDVETVFQVVRQEEAHGHVRYRVLDALPFDDYAHLFEAPAVREQLQPMAGAPR